jgi:hypothetical protein
MYLSMLVSIFIDRSNFHNPLEQEIDVCLFLSMACIVHNSWIGVSWKNFESEVHHTIPPLFFDGHN